MLRRIFGCKRQELRGGSGTLHSKEPYNLYSLPNIMKVIKSRRMTWAGHVERVGDNETTYIILVRKPGGKDHLGDLCVMG
jgi:hypothetical protein